MENFDGIKKKEKRPSSSNSINLNSTKSPRNFQLQDGGVVGLGIVAAMTTNAHLDPIICFAPSPSLSPSPSPRSTTMSMPIPIPILSSAKAVATANFRPPLHLQNFDDTRVFSHFYHNLINKHVYFGDDDGNNNKEKNSIVFTASLSSSPNKASLGQL